MGEIESDQLRAIADASPSLEAGLIVGLRGNDFGVSTPRFDVLPTPQKPVTAWEQWKGKEIAEAVASVTNFATDRRFAEAEIGSDFDQVQEVVAFHGYVSYIGG
jgi:hypothetical protein